MSPTRVGNYRIIASLGSGGMADVMLAARTGPVNFTKLVVIKRLRADLVAQPDAGRYRSLLLDEARLAARMHHPHVVQTFEVMEDAGEPYITMEYLDGQSLSQVVRAVRSEGTPVLPRDFVVRVIADVLSALTYAHDLADFDGTRLDIVHRDVSPQNIFWTYEGEIKLMDFGVAKSSQGTTKTQAGFIKGKLSYMAPEQARGEQIDRRVDVFAAGVVLWELLAGRRLFKAANEAATLHKLLYEPIPSLRELVPGIDPALAATCERSLAHDRNERYPDATTMRADLERVLGERGPRREVLGGFVQQLFVERRREVAELIRTRLARDDAPVTQIVPAEGEDSLESLADDTQHSRPDQQTVASHPRAVRAPATMQSEAAPRRRRGVIAALIAAIVVTGSAAGILLGRRLHDESHPSAEASGSTRLAVATEQHAPTTAGTATVAPPPVLALCGSNTIDAELGPALVDAFLRKLGATGINRAVVSPDDIRITAMLDNHPIAITLAAHGTATAFEGLTQGACDVGMASRAVKEDELAKLAQAGIGNLRRPATEHVIALDGIAVVVHPDNPLRTLTRTQLHDVFTGKIASWSQVGGTASPIAVYARDDKSGTYDMFKSSVLGSDPLVASAKRIEASDGLADAVATDPAAIGFVGLAYVRSAKTVAVSDIGTRALLPTSFTVTTEDYMLSRRLYLYTLPKPRTQLVAELVSFATSQAGQDVVRDAGFIDLAALLRDGEACDEHCPPAYAAAIAHAKRVSLDFRFRAGGNDIDSRATRDLDRLVQLLRAHPAGKLLLLGFSDAASDRSASTKLSRERAQAIAGELESRGVAAATIEGFGDAMPVASNATDSGRERNRRVEVWLRE